MHASPKGRFFENVDRHDVQALRFDNVQGISATLISFSETASVWLRDPYVNCKISKCPLLREDELAVDVQTRTEAKSIIYSRKISDREHDKTRLARPLAMCVDVDAGDNVVFAIKGRKTNSLDVEILVNRVD